MSCILVLGRLCWSQLGFVQILTSLRLLVSEGKTEGSRLVEQESVKGNAACFPLGSYCMASASSSQRPDRPIEHMGCQSNLGATPQVKPFGEDEQLCHLLRPHHRSDCSPPGMAFLIPVRSSREINS